jgi:hypothetical protein
MICTAAGREGINLQHARVLFNFDLPWNPMDIEQRIDRIHRYGQRHTAQVYNLVLSDTIEGRIFLLLQDKLTEIAKTLGKVDEHGDIAEDLRAQILGQLSERLSYESLYSQALSDPELRRTRLELEAALSNAAEAHEVVFELFQDLDSFSLEDYQPFSDISEGMSHLVRFLCTAVEEDGQQLRPIDGDVLTITYETLLELYFQNPEFGYYLLSLTSERLLQNISRLEGVLDARQRRRELREMAFQHRQHRVLLDVVHSELGVDLGTVVVGKEAIALQSSRRHQDENAKGSVAEPEPRGQILRKHPNLRINAV